MRFEDRREPLLPWPQFLWRLAGSFAVGLVMVGISLAIGMLGYRSLMSLSWIDAFVNASMILSGMGPADQLKTDAGKLFAGFYALYSGLVIVLASGIILAPVVHRILHRFHVDEAD